jgi:hypothetical protein
MKNSKRKQIRCSMSIAVAIALAFALANATARGEVVADFPISSFTGGIAFFGSGSFRPAQTFTALDSGELQTISVALAQNGPVLPSHVVVEFRSTFSDIPSSSILATSTVDGSLLAGSPVMLSADFSAFHISLSAGSIYAFSLRTDDAGAASACGSGAYIAYPYNGGAEFASFDSGITWSAQSLYDLNFQVTSVPEPTTLLLFGLGGVIAARKRQNRLTVTGKRV